MTARHAYTVKYWVWVLVWFLFIAIQTLLVYFYYWWGIGITFEHHTPLLSIYPKYPNINGGGSVAFLAPGWMCVQDPARFEWPQNRFRCTAFFFNWLLNDPVDYIFRDDKNLNGIPDSGGISKREAPPMLAKRQSLSESQQGYYGTATSQTNDFLEMLESDFRTYSQVFWLWLTGMLLLIFILLYFLIKRGWTKHRKHQQGGQMGGSGGRQQKRQKCCDHSHYPCSIFLLLWMFVLFILVIYWTVATIFNFVYLKRRNDSFKDTYSGIYWYNITWNHVVVVPPVGILFSLAGIILAYSTHHRLSKPAPKPANQGQGQGQYNDMMDGGMGGGMMDDGMDGGMM